MWHRPHPPCSSSRSDTFEGQSQWEWDGPSDEHWLPSTSVGFQCLCRLITLQSSAGALRAVNYFTEQRGDVPSCEPETEWEAEERRPSINQGKLEEMKQGSLERVGEKLGWERDTRSERHGGKIEHWKAGARGLPAIMSPQTACAVGDRPALMTKVTNLSLIRQRELERERDRWRDSGRKGITGNRQHQHN